MVLGSWRSATRRSSLQEFLINKEICVHIYIYIYIYMHSVAVKPTAPLIQA